MIKKIVGSLLGIVICFGLVGCTNTENDYSDNSNSQSENTIQKENSSKELTESEKISLKILDLFEQKLAFDSGDYIKGDIPAGEYAFVKFSESGSYYCEKDAAGNIIDNENFDSFGYVKVHAIGNLTNYGILINTSAFEQLGVTGAKQIYELLNNQTNYNQAGYYKVGVDIEPGQYVIESFGSGYWAIMTGPVSASDIVDNDNFNGKASVTLRNGQYITISRATITKQ